MEYRKATASDTPALCALRKIQLIDEGLTPAFSIDDELADFFAQAFAANSLVQIVAVEGGEIIATGGVLFYAYPPSYSNQSGKTAYITNMYTTPKYRKQGLASAILGQLVAEAKIRGAQVIRLRASTDGKPVYKRFGFTEESDWLRYH